MRKGFEALCGRPKWMAAILMFSALLLTGCVSTKGSSTPASSASVIATIVAMGKPATTAAGNIVVVHSYLSPVASATAAGAGMIYAAADVEACAGPNASSQTGVASNLFALQTADQTGWASVGPVKKPSLQPTYLSPNHCERGWVTFRLPKAQKAVYVVLLSSAVVKWKIP
jgi:hypothetical protein